MRETLLSFLDETKNYLTQFLDPLTLPETYPSSFLFLFRLGSKNRNYWDLLYPIEFLRIGILF